jgi:hypothetical protein
LKDRWAIINCSFKNNLEKKTLNSTLIKTFLKNNGEFNFLKERKVISRFFRDFKIPIRDVQVNDITWINNRDPNKRTQ